MGKQTATKGKAWTEARITIEGVELSFAESMALRVAVGGQLMHMSERGALGTDLTGESIRQGYVRHLSRIQNLIHAGTMSEPIGSDDPTRKP